MMKRYIAGFSIIKTDGKANGVLCDVHFKALNHFDLVSGSPDLAWLFKRLIIAYRRRMMKH